MTFADTAGAGQGMGRRAAWQLAVALALVHLTSSLDRHVVGLILTPLQQEFELSDTILGLLHGSMYTLFYALAILPCGVLADRVSRKAMVAVAALLWSGGTAAFAMAESLPMLMAARLVVGLGQAAFVPAALSLIASAFSADRVGQPLGLFTSASAMGRATALIGGGAILAWLAALDSGVFAATSPWRTMLLLSLGINALAVLLLLAAPSAPRVDKPAAQATGTAELLRHLIVQRRSYAAILVGAMMTILLVQSISAWAPTLLVRRFALSVPQSGWTVGLIVMMTAPLGNLLGGAVLDRARSAPGVFLHRRIIALALVGVAFAGPLICLAPSPALAFAGLALTSVALGIATPVGLAGVQRLSPEALRGRIAAGFVAAVSLVSFGLGPLMVGWMSTRLFSGADSLSLALLLSITLSAAAGIAATLPRRAKAGAGR